MANKNFKLFSIIAITLILLMAVVAAGCTTQQTTTTTPTATPTPTTRTITDDLGRSVTIPTNITRVSASNWMFDLTLDMLGVGKTDVASSTVAVNNCPELIAYYPGLKNVSTPWVSIGSTLNVETLLADQPQVVFVPAWDPSLNASIDSGLPVIAFNDTTFDDYKKLVSVLGEIYGGNAQKTANEYLSYVNGEQANITSRVADIPAGQRQVFVQTYYWSGHGWGAWGSDDYVNSLLTMCGGTSAVPANISGGFVTEEQELLYAQNATVIFVGNTATVNQIKNDTAWQNVPAVKNNRVYCIPHGIEQWETIAPEYGGLLPYWCAKTLYPDRFQDINMSARMKYFYPTFMRYNISDEEIHMMMANMTSNSDQNLNLDPSEVIPQ
jgi:iron complex transport system substrate-binding protein